MSRVTSAFLSIINQIQLKFFIESFESILHSNRFGFTIIAGNLESKKQTKAVEVKNQITYCIL
jgi:hypothetical protein